MPGITWVATGTEIVETTDPTSWPCSSLTPNIGDLIHVEFQVYGGGGAYQTPTVADAHNGSYAVESINQDSTYYSVGTAWVIATSASAVTPTLTFGTGSNGIANWTQHRGVASSSSLRDQNTAIVGNASTPQSVATTAALTQAGDLVIACFAPVTVSDSSGISTPATGTLVYTDAWHDQLGNTHLAMDVSYGLATVGGNQTGTWLWTSGNFISTGAIIQSFKPLGGGGASTNQLPLLGVGAIAPLAWIIRRRQQRARELRGWRQDQSTGIILPDYKRSAK